MSPVAPHIFDTLTPDRVLDLVEGALGCRCNGICRSRASYINRVYEVGLNDGGFVIAKFYRPGRWSRVALQDELDFVSELATEELPVVPPLPGKNGALLQTEAGLTFAIFPRCGGRPLEELTQADWQQLGRLLARLHTVGARHAPRDRITLGPATSLAAQLRFLADGNFIPGGLRGDYCAEVEAIMALITPLFAGVPLLRIHGDCHRGNILHRPGEAFHLIDFDDMALGPTVQDIWMLLPGHPRESLTELDALAEGYEMFRPFDWDGLRLVESLRAMRFVHYAAWCGRQQADQGFVQTVPGWGTVDYWRQEIEQLARQREEILATHDDPPLG
ncbi:MAG: serine/threonine protein kinase [bacterium]